MMTRLLPWVLLAVAAVVYTRQLGDMPTYISPDEAIIAVDKDNLMSTVVADGFHSAADLK